MKKLGILLSFLSVVAAAYSRGGAGPVVNLTYREGTISEMITENEDQYTWNINVGENVNLRIDYNISLTWGDIVDIKQRRNGQNETLVSLDASATNNIFRGTVYTTAKNGQVSVVLSMLGGNPLTDIISFHYEVIDDHIAENILAFESFGSFGSADLKFKTSDETRMTIANSNGFVGIGTEHPDAMLDVRGRIRANEVLVNVPTGADYVFEDGYKLRSIEELSAYVNQNHHLPEIQPAAEMEQNGVTINEFQIQLLQKIEELTLYIIQQQKEIEDLREAIVAK